MPDKREWISRAEFARRIGRSTRSVEALVKNGTITEHRPPGLRPRYWSGDADRFAPRPPETPPTETS